MCIGRLSKERRSITLPHALFMSAWSDRQSPGRLVSTQSEWQREWSINSTRIDRLLNSTHRDSRWVSISSAFCEEWSWIKALSVRNGLSSLIFVCCVLGLGRGGEHCSVNIWLRVSPWLALSIVWSLWRAAGMLSRVCQQIRDEQRLMEKGSFALLYLSPLDI